MAEAPNTTNLPIGNQDQRVRFLGDVGDLSKMVGVFFGEIERAFLPTRGRPGACPGTIDLAFSMEWVDRIMFLAVEVYDRSRSLALRAQAMENEDEIGGEPRGRPCEPVADSFAVLADLEGAIAMIEAYRDAVSELASTTGNAPRRLAGISAICGPLGEEVDVATEAVRKLYENRERAQEGHSA